MQHEMHKPKRMLTANEQKKWTAKVKTKELRNYEFSTKQSVKWYNITSTFLHIWLKVQPKGSPVTPFGQRLFVPAIQGSWCTVKTSLPLTTWSGPFYSHHPSKCPSDYRVQPACHPSVRPSHPCNTKWKTNKVLI